METRNRPKTLHTWTVLYLLAALMGLIGGATAILLKEFISWARYVFQEVFFSWLDFQIGTMHIGYIIIPALGGLIVGLIVRYSQETEGSGIPILIESMALQGAQIRPRVGFLKLLASSITIGSGGNAGREGPIALIGASIGSLFGQKLNLTAKDRRLLMTCGLSAGIAGSFHSPIGGAVFGLEILFQGVTLLESVPVFLAAALGTLLVEVTLGTEPIIQMNFSISGTHFNEYFFFILIGIVFGLIAIGWIRFFHYIRRKYRQGHLPRWIRPVIGGLITGILIMISPSNQLIQSEFSGIQKVLDGQFLLGALIILGILKMIATGNTIGSGGSGGIFAPSLFIGTMFGGAAGIILNEIFPSVVTNSELYALIGMAALFSATGQAPLNISIMIAEMTEDFGLVPPLLLASIISFLVSRQILKGGSIYLELQESPLKADSLFILDSVRVNEIMNEKIVSVSPELPLTEFASFINLYKLEQYPVKEMGHESPIGLVYADSLFHIPYEQWEKFTIKDIMVRDLFEISPFSKLQSALDEMQEHKLRALLVIQTVDNENGEKEKVLKGILTLKDIIRTFQKSRGITPQS